MIVNKVSSGKEKITNASEIGAIAQNEIKIGDTVYTVLEDIGPPVSDIYADNNGTALSKSFENVVFSPNGKLLVLSSRYYSLDTKVYSVVGTTITYIYDIPIQASAAAFSPDGSMLVLCSGNESDGGYAKVYSVNDTTITYVNDIYADNNGTAFDDEIQLATFSPDGKALVLGGWLTWRGSTSYFKIYSVNGTTITYVSDIYADAEGTEILEAEDIFAATFSLDSKFLIVMGDSAGGYAKLYSVDDTAAVSYIKDIISEKDYSIQYPRIATFSPNGKILVLTGNYWARIYSVSDTSITYIDDIYADNNDTAWSEIEIEATFSPDGNLLILNTNKIYLVNDTTVTYVCDIYANDSGTVSGALSPDGKTLVVSGNFTGKAKVYKFIDYLAFSAPDGIITATRKSVAQVGFAKNNASEDENVKVKLIGSLVPPLLPDGPTLNDCSWNNINKIAATGKAANYWSVGDCKEITLNGKVETLSLSNYKTCVYIIGFDHNGSIGTIDFGTFKTAASSGIDVCLIDGVYYRYYTNGTKYFNQNHWGNYNYGGWKGSDLRYDVLGSTDVAPSGYRSAVTTSRAGYDASALCATIPVSRTLMAALPSDLRAVMKPMTIYTDNTGGGSNTASYVTSSVDYLPLLAEFEIFGTRSYANSAEKNYQKQYAYYSAGNSKVKYCHSATSSTAHWWERSPYCTDRSAFCYVLTSGGASGTGAGSSYGLAPIFRVGGEIVFRIGGTHYAAQEGMTWEEWINSDYNTINLTVLEEDGSLVVGNMSFIHNNANVMPKDIIINCGTYAIGGGVND